MALLTGGGDRPYALGLATALSAAGVSIDFIGSDDLESPELRADPRVRFLNLRGSQDPSASRFAKTLRVARYYVRLVGYAARSKASIFHLLWNNKIEAFDRTLLMLYYKFLGKRVVLTVHNVNKHKRDGNDTWMNRTTLRMHYRLADHLFAHTEKMKRELQVDFEVAENRISVIPFGLNSTVPDTALTPAEARLSLGIGADEKVLLFFGNIAPYKGLEYLVEALGPKCKPDQQYRLIIAGRPKGAESYWERVQQSIAEAGLAPFVIERIEYVPDADTEIYFKAADVLVLPYTTIFQSGVLFLGYNFGLPVIASDVGELREDIIEGVTGHLCQPMDPVDLARGIEKFFSSTLYEQRSSRGRRIRDWADERHSWARVADITISAYGHVA